MKYNNLLSDNTVVYQEDKIFSKKELIKEFELFINGGGYKINKWISTERAPYHCIIEKGNNKYELIFFLKNISGAGWINKPNVKRVQVTNVRNGNSENYIITSKHKTLLVLGYYNFDNRPIMACWDAYRYVEHRTNRSAYISIDNLIEGYNNGFICTVCSSQKLWVFTKENFDKFLNDYFTYNYESGE